MEQAVFLLQYLRIQTMNKHNFKIELNYMKKLIFITLLLSFFVNKTSLAQALSVDAAILSRYMAHGVDVGMSDQEVYQLGIYKPLTSNLKFAVWSSFPIDRQFDNLDEVDIMLIWSKSFFNDSRFKLVPNCYVDYWFYHGTKVSEDIDGNSIEEMTFQGNKFNVGLTLPNLMAVAGNPLVVSYNYFYWSPLFEKTFQKGGIHEIGLNYGLPLLIDTEKQVFNIGLSTNYSENNVLQSNTGWTNMAFHLSTPLAKGSWTLSPSIHYQWTWEQSINKENEFWFGFNIGKSFGS